MPDSWDSAHITHNTHHITQAAALSDRKTLVIVCHYDFICAILDAILLPETTGHFARWRHHNTALTVVDISAATGEVGGRCGVFLDGRRAALAIQVTFVKQNEAAHLLEHPELLSGFPL